MVQYLKKQLEIVEWYIVGLFFLITPAIYSKKILDPVLYSRYYALSIFLLVVTILLGVFLYYRRFKFRMAKYDRIVFGFAGLYILWSFLSVIGAINVKEGIFQALKEMGLMMSFFYFYQLLRNNSRGREFIIKCLVLTTGIFLGIGFVQLTHVDFTDYFNAEGSGGYQLMVALTGVFSTFSGKNLFPMALVLLLPFSIYSIIFHNKFWKVLSSVVLLSSFFWILLMTSKSAWLYQAIFVLVIYVLFLIYIFVLYPNEKGKSFNLLLRRLIVIVPLVLILGGVIGVFKSDLKIFSLINDKARQVFSDDFIEESIYSVDNPSSAQTRKIVWNQTLNIAKDHPIFGVGAGNWRIVNPQYGLDKFEDKLRQGSMIFQRPHNDMLWIAAENGFVGLLFYLGFYFSIIVLAYRNFVRASDVKIKWFSALSFAALLGFFVVMQLDFPRERIAINMIYLLILAIVLSDSPFKSEKEECDLPLKINGLIILSLVGLLVFNLIVARQIFEGEKAARMAKYALENKKWRLLQRSAYLVENTFYTLDAYCVPMKFYEGVAWSGLEKNEDANKAFKLAYGQNPNNLRLLNNYATSFERLGKTDSALVYYEKAIAISPRYKDALVNGTIVSLQLKQFDKSLDYISRVDNNHYVPEKYDITMITVAKVQASLIYKELDIEKLKVWYNDENKIRRTFVKFKKENREFRQILLDELGKN